MLNDQLSELIIYLTKIYINISNTSTISVDKYIKLINYVASSALVKDDILQFVNDNKKYVGLVEDKILVSKKNISKVKISYSKALNTALNDKIANFICKENEQQNKSYEK